MRVSLFALGVFVFLDCNYCVAQTADEIIERYIDTVSNGDIKNWRKIKSVLLEREVFYSQGRYDQPGPIFSHPKVHYHKTYRVFPDKLKTEIYADSTYRELLSSWWYLSDKTIVQFKNMDPIIKPKSHEQNGLWDFRR